MKTTYNYREAMLEDVKEYLEAEFDAGEIREQIEDDFDMFKESLLDSCWTADSVTGNGSGSYTFNRWQAQEYVQDNMGLCVEALTEFGCIEQLAEKITEDDWEWIDVTIRCFLLPFAIYEVLEELKDQMEDEE